MTPEQASRFAEEWVAAWNAHDLERILRHYADAVEFHSPFVMALLGEPSGMISGKDALRNYFARGLAAYPDLRFQFQQVLTGAGSVTLYYRSVKNLWAAEVMEFDESGLVKRVLAHYAPA